MADSDGSVEEPTSYETQNHSILDDNLVQIDSSDETPVPLQTGWTFWVDKTESRGISAAQYEANLKMIYTVNTVQGFWAVFNNIPDVAELKLRYTYHLMRAERRPLWEDSCNRRGGTWRIKCSKKDSPTVWKELLLACIGEQFSEDVSEGDEVCGVSVCVRDKDDILQIWNADARLNEGSTVLQKAHRLLPGISFLAEFYKPHQSRLAFEGGHKRMSR